MARLLKGVCAVVVETRTDLAVALILSLSEDEGDHQNTPCLCTPAGLDVQPS